MLFIPSPIEILLFWYLIHTCLSIQRFDQKISANSNKFRPSDILRAKSLKKTNKQDGSSKLYESIIDGKHIRLIGTDA